MKKIFLLIATVAMLTACNGNGSTSGNRPSGDSTAQATEQPATELPEEEIEEIEITEMKGPGTIECKNFTIDVPQDWEGQYVQDPRSIKLSVKAPSNEIFDFIYHEQSNFTQEKQLMMERDGMQDLGEKTFGNNTYATFLGKQDAVDTYIAIMKIGDGNSGTIKVSAFNVNTADNKMIPAILGNVKMK